MITTSSYEPRDAEKFYIKSLSSNNKTLELNSTSKKHHTSYTSYFNNKPFTMSAKVALITRYTLFLFFCSFPLCIECPAYSVLLPVSSVWYPVSDNKSPVSVVRIWFLFSISFVLDHYGQRSQMFLDFGQNFQKITYYKIYRQSFLH